jgi:hypothetical protein
VISPLSGVYLGFGVDVGPADDLGAQYEIAGPSVRELAFQVLEVSPEVHLERVEHHRPLPVELLRQLSRKPVNGRLPADLMCK